MSSPTEFNPSSTLSASASSEKPTGVRYQVMGFLGVLAFLTYFDRVCITQAASRITADLELTNVQMGWIMGAFWLAYALFELPMGKMGDQHGARITLSRIVLAWSLFTALSGAAIGFWSLIACRFMFGIGEAGAFPNMARIQSRWLPVASRPVFGGLLWMLARWGGAFSYPIFGLMMRAFDSDSFRTFTANFDFGLFSAPIASWRIAFWVAGLLGVAWVAAYYPWFRDHPSEKSTVNKAELELITKGAPPEVKGHAMPSELWRLLLTNRSLLALGILYLCSSFGWSFFTSWMPKYFQDVQGVKLGKSDLMLAAPLFCGGIMCFVGGFACNWLVARTNRRIGRAILPVCGYIISAISMALIPFMKTPEQAMLLLCLAEAAHDMGQGANWASIVDIGGKYAGVAAGLINTIGNMGNAFQPVIGAYIFTNFGWNTMFMTYSVAFLVAASMWTFIDPRKTFYESHETGVSA